MHVYLYGVIELSNKKSSNSNGYSLIHDNRQCRYEYVIDICALLQWDMIWINRVGN